MKKTLLLLLFVLVSFSVFPDAFTDWKKQQSLAFEAYKQDEDSAFRAFLEKEWQEFQVYEGIIQDTSPKLEEPPISDKLSLSFNFGRLFKSWFSKSRVKTEETISKEKTELSDEPVGNKPSVEEETIQDDSQVNIKQDPPEAVSSDIPVPAGPHIKLNYFGNNFSIPMDRNMEVRISVVSESSIASFWREISRSNYSPSLEGLAKSREVYGLNDWGYAIQVHKFSESLYKNNSWNSKLLTWFLLTKSGISARVAYRGGIYI